MVSKSEICSPNSLTIGRAGREVMKIVSIISDMGTCMEQKAHKALRTEQC